MIEPLTLAAASASPSRSILAFLIALAVACICSMLAARKGRNRIAWSVAGFFFSVFALIVIAVLPPSRTRREELRS